MRTLVGGTSVLILVGAISGAAALLSRETASAGAAFQAAASRPLVTMAEYERWQKELSNWGRWGPNDVNGTLNLITPAKRKQVAALVKEGFSVSLASDVPTQKSPVSPCPAEWAMVSGSADRIAFPCIHGPGLTHLDALLGHVSFNGKTFNGYPVEGVVTKERGVAKGSIHNGKNGIVTRAVLYDIPRLKGVPYLEPGTRVFPEDLEAWEKKVGARVGAGDALLFRWGRWVREAKVGQWPITAQAAGLDNSVIPWLKKRDVAVIGWETPGYRPQPPGDIPGNPVHDFAIGMLGMQVLDRADFDALSEAAAARNRWEFMLTISPLAIRHGTGSPVNPLAIF